MNPVVRAIAPFLPLGQPSTVDVASAVEQRYEAFAARGFDGRAFDLELPDGISRRFGKGPAAFRLRVRTEKGARAIAAFDELAIAEAYLHGDLDITGDMLAMFQYRDTVMDLHPVQYVVS